MNNALGGIGTGLSSFVSQLQGVAGGSTSPTEAGSSFGDVFKAAVGGVDALQSSADQKVGTLLSGGGNADVGSVMVSVEKADVAFQLMMQVRNKIVNAYQDIEKMQF